MNSVEHEHYLKIRMHKSSSREYDGRELNSSDKDDTIEDNIMVNKIKRTYRRIVFVLFDCIFLFLAWELSAYVNGFHIWGSSAELPFLMTAGLVAVQIGILALFKMYLIPIHSASIDLFLVSSYGFFIGDVITLIAVYTQSAYPNILHLLLPYWSFSMLFVLGYRIAYRALVYYDVNGKNGFDKPRAVIYGAGDVGEQILRLYRHGQLDYKIVGIIDDNPVKWNAVMHGFRVFRGIQDLYTLIEQHNAQYIIVAATKIDQDRMGSIIDNAAELGIEVKIIPSLLEVAEKRKQITDVRDITYEDLLGRDPIEIERQPVMDLIYNKKVLITGAGGSIGQEICRQTMGCKPKQLQILDIDETEVHNLALELNDYTTAFSESVVPIVCDIRNEEKVQSIIAKYKPDIIFHAAAYKHVPLMEYYPEEAIRTNVAGTYNICSAAVDHGVRKCILISTDKAVNPTNVMGATKRMAELIGSMLTNSITEIVSVRFGNVLGSRGSMLPLFIDQINAGVPITVTHKDIIRYFMTIPEAVSLVSLAGAAGKGGEVMVLDMGKPVRIYDFAQKLIKRFGDGRSSIMVTGLRPGEKLYEELMTQEDQVIRTKHAKVFKAILRNGYDKEAILEFVRSINHSDKTSDELAGELKYYIPGFSEPETCVRSAGAEDVG